MQALGPDVLRWVARPRRSSRMAAWMLCPTSSTTRRERDARFGVFGTTVVAFFLAEMGDKTQIATMALAARYHDLLQVVLGTTLGMMLANVPAVLLGDRMARKMSMRRRARHRGRRLRRARPADALQPGPPPVRDPMHTHHLAGWRHEHVFDTGNPAGERSTRWVMWITAAMMVVEIVAGWMSNSMALLADGFHMSSHAVAIGLSAFAYGAARRHANDPRFAFGTWKIEVLGGFASAVVLVLVAALMVYGSVDHLLKPEPIVYREALLIAVVGLVVNLVCAWMLGTAHHHGHAHGEHGHSHDHDHGHAHAPAHTPRPHTTMRTRIRSPTTAATAISTCARPTSTCSPTPRPRWPRSRPSRAAGCSAGRGSIRRSASSAR